MARYKILYQSHCGWVRMTVLEAPDAETARERWTASNSAQPDRVMAVEVSSRYQRKLRKMEKLNMARSRTNPTAPPVEHATGDIIPAPHNEPGRDNGLAPLPDTDLSLCPTNLDLRTQRGKAMAIAAGSPADIEIDADGEAHIIATHWLIFPERRRDEETGKIGQFCRTVFFDPDGRTMRTSSAHAPEVMQRMLALFGPDEWAKGIHIVLRERKSRRTGGTYHDFRVIPRDE